MRKIIISFCILFAALSLQAQSVNGIRTTNTSDPMQLYLFHWASQTDAQVFAQGWAFRGKNKVIIRYYRKLKFFIPVFSFTLFFLDRFP